MITTTERFYWPYGMWQRRKGGWVNWLKKTGLNRSNMLSNVIGGRQSPSPYLSHHPAQYGAAAVRSDFVSSDPQ